MQNHNHLKRHSKKIINLISIRATSMKISQFLLILSFTSTSPTKPKLSLSTIKSPKQPNLTSITSPMYKFQNPWTTTRSKKYSKPITNVHNTKKFKTRKKTHPINTRSMILLPLKKSKKIPTTNRATSKIYPSFPSILTWLLNPTFLCVLPPQSEGDTKNLLSLSTKNFMMTLTGRITVPTNTTFLLLKRTIF